MFPYDIQLHNPVATAHALISTTMTEGKIVYTYDDGWDQAMVKSKGRKRYDEIDKWLFKQGLLCRCQGGQYIFIDTVNSWCNLSSHDAMARITSMAGMDNVSVSQDKAMRPFNDYIIKRCDSRVCGSLPLSVCIGTHRLEIDIETEPGTMKFHHCRPLLEGIPSSVSSAVKGVCIMPVSTDIYPSTYVFPGKGVVLQYLMNLFDDLRDAVTFFWHVGNCLIDPVSMPKSVILTGPGGTGKSTILMQLMSCLGTCVSVIPDGSLTGIAKSMPAGVAEAVVGSRMIVCFDVDLEKNKLNMNTFKNISGSDYLYVGYTRCKSNCSLTLATNGIINIDDEPEYHSDAIMRRVVAIRMSVDALSIPATILSEETDIRLDFVCACLHFRLKYDSMPVSPMTILTTLCASKMDTVLEYVCETFDGINEHDGSGVLSVISSALGLTTKQVVQKVKLISPNALTIVNEHEYIKGLKLSLHN